MLQPAHLSQRRPSAPALVLIDSSFVPVCYNAEAIRVLIYPQDPEDVPSLPKHIETKLRSVSSVLRLPRRAPGSVTIESGRRQYVARTFTFNNHRKPPASLANGYPMLALLLERPERYPNAAQERDPLDVVLTLMHERQKRHSVDLSPIAAQFRLTPREKETLQYLTEGLTGKEIAHQMQISPHTVKAFLRLVMSKMQVSRRIEIFGKILTVGH